MGGQTHKGEIQGSYKFFYEPIKDKSDERFLRKCETNGCRNGQDSLKSQVDRKIKVPKCATNWYKMRIYIVLSKNTNNYQENYL